MRKRTKGEFIASILRNSVYQSDSGLYRNLDKALATMSVENLSGLELITAIRGDDLATRNEFIAAIPSPRKVMLVYQAGVANVFEVDSFQLSDEPTNNRRRIMQGAFGQCLSFAMGCGAMGAIVRTAHCNMAGNIAGCDWSDDMEAAPFNPRPLTIN